MGTEIQSTCFLIANTVKGRGNLHHINNVIFLISSLPRQFNIFMLHFWVYLIKPFFDLNFKHQLQQNFLSLFYIFMSSLSPAFSESQSFHNDKHDWSSQSIFQAIGNWNKALHYAFSKMIFWGIVSTICPSVMWIHKTNSKDLVNRNTFNTEVEVEILKIKIICYTRLKFTNDSISKCKRICYYKSLTIKLWLCLNCKIKSNSQIICFYVNKLSRKKLKLIKHLNRKYWQWHVKKMTCAGV